MTPNTQTIREREIRFKNDYKDKLFPFGGDWHDFDVEAFYEILTSHHSDLKQRVEDLLPKPGVTVMVSNHPEINAQTPEKRLVAIGYAQALEDVLTLLETNEKDLTK